MPRRAGAKERVANQALTGTSQEDTESGAMQVTPAPATKLGVEEGMIYTLEKLVEEIGSVKRGWRPDPSSVGERLLDRMVDRCHRLMESINSQKEEERKEVEEEWGPGSVFCPPPTTWKEMAMESHEREKAKKEGKLLSLFPKKKEAEKEDVEMGDIGSPSPKTTTDAATNTETTIRTYAQPAAQTPRGKGKGPSPPVAKPEVSEVSGRAAGLPQRFPYVEDLSDYEEEEGGTMAKAVVVHGVPTTWRINGVADCVGRIMGEIIGVRWLLGVRRREGKTASSVVVYLENEVFLGPKACMKMSGKRHSVLVVYRWSA